MTAQSALDLMTLEEWAALPEDHEARDELQEGVLISMPRWTEQRYLRAQQSLLAQLQAQVPEGWEALGEFEVVVEPEGLATVRVPDLVVVPSDGPEERVPAEEVLLAVEIVSPGTRKVDRQFKKLEYAEAGIPHYWVVDVEPPVPSITVYGLGAGGGGYAESRPATGTLVVSEPFPVQIDVATLG